MVWCHICYSTYNRNEIIGIEWTSKNVPVNPFKRRHPRTSSKCHETLSQQERHLWIHTNKSFSKKLFSIVFLNPFLANDNTFRGVAFFGLGVIFLACITNSVVGERLQCIIIEFTFQVHSVAATKTIACIYRYYEKF